MAVVRFGLSLLVPAKWLVGNTGMLHRSS